MNHFQSSNCTAMYCNKCVFCLWILVNIKFCQTFLFGKKLPCHFYDSINITNGVRHSNNSITFNGIEYPPDQYSEMTYDLINNIESIKVHTYIRGCLCAVRSCIRLCCPFGSFVDEMMENGIKCRTNDTAKKVKFKVIDSNNQTKLNYLNEHFVHIDRICNQYSNADGFKIHQVIENMSSLITSIQINRISNIFQ